MTQAPETFAVISDHIKYVPPQNVQDAYVIVLDVANRVLRSCRLFSIDGLKEENPTIAEIASRMRVICKLMRELDECDGLGDQLTVQKAHEYADLVQSIAAAVDANDEAELKRQTDLLNDRSFL